MYERIVWEKLLTLQRRKNLVMKGNIAIYIVLMVLLCFACQSPVKEVSRKEIYSLLRQADSCGRNKQEKLAIQQYFEILEYAEKTETSRFKADIYRKIGTLYMYRNLYVDAVEMFRRSAELYQMIGDWKEEAVTWRNIGRANLMRQRSDSIIYYYQRAIELAKETGEHELFGEIQQEFQFVCSKNALLQGNTRLWLHYLDMLDSTDASYLLLGTILAKQPFGYEQAEEWLLKAVRSHDIYICTNAYRALYDWAKKIGNEEKATRYADLYIQYADSLEKEHSSSLAFHELGESYEKQCMMVENERLKNHQLTRTAYLLALIACLCLFLLIGVHLYNKEKRKRERELVGLMQQIRDKEHLIEDLRNRQQEHELQEEEQRKMPKRCEVFDLLYRMKMYPRYGMIEDEEEWLELYAVINLLYGDIVGKLEGCPLLTAQDVRICYLLHARFGNAVLGVLFNVDARSVTKSKQRIKKKMEIPSELSLEEFLMK